MVGDSLQWRVRLFIVPVNVDDYSSRFPKVVASLAVIDTVILAYSYLLSSPTVVFHQFGFIPATPHFSTAFTSMFLHSGVFHLLGNMFFLYMFGSRIEERFGPFWFSVIFIACGFGATGLHWIANLGSEIPCVGASGAISGIAGVYFILYPQSRFELAIYLFRFHVKSIPTRTRGAVGAWLAEQAFLGLITQAVRFSSVAFLAHVGGFITGAAIALVFGFFTVSEETVLLGISDHDSPLNDLHVHASKSHSQRRFRDRLRARGASAE